MRFPGDAADAHPLEDSDRLAWQATAAVTLLERFGDLLTVALEAVGDGDDAALGRALEERDRLVAQLEPLLAALAGARARARAWTVAHGGPDAAGPGRAGERAVAAILAPVDDALRHAQYLHRRLADEVGERAGRSAPACATLRRPADAPVALVR